MTLLFEWLKVKLFEKYFENKFDRKKSVCSFKGNKDVFNRSQSIEGKPFASCKLLVTSFKSLVTSY